MAKRVRERQAARRQAAEAQQRTRTTYIIIGVVGALVLAAIVYYLFAALAPATVAVAQIAPGTCGPIQDQQDDGRAHLVAGETPTYHTNPPSSGTHNPNPLPAGVYSTMVDVTAEVHSQEHGYIIIHYNGISSSEIQALEQLVERDPRKMILSPYPNMDYKLTLTAWNHLQVCNGVNAQAITSFVGLYRDHGPENAP
ncbi:MAG: DUF3105 domain-containing protein [Anaerolineae bacterium]